MCHALLPLVTVVTVTRNAEESIERTIASVSSQNYANIEYLVLDGKSSDHTCEIIRTHIDCITHFVSEEDDGIYDAMNKGIRMASPHSRFITFLNAGDVFFDSGVIRQVVSATTLPRAHIYGDIVQAGRRTHYPEKLTLSHLSTAMVCHQAFFFDTATHRNYLYDTRFKICADYKLLIDLIRAREHFVKINIPIVIFAPGGVSQRNTSALRLEKKRIRRMYPQLEAYHVFKQTFGRVRTYLHKTLQSRNKCI